MTNVHRQFVLKMTQLERRKHKKILDLTLSKFQKFEVKTFTTQMPIQTIISLHDKVEDVVLLLIIVKILKYSDFDYRTHFFK
jgi:hypothetical protein